MSQKSNSRRMIIGFVIIIFATVLSTLGFIHVFGSFDSKQVINLKQEPIIQNNQMQIQVLNSTTLTAQIISTTRNGNQTTVFLSNEDRFIINSTSITVGEKVQVDKQFYKPLCTLNLYDSNNTLVTNIFDELASNKYTINGTKNPACNTTKPFSQITGIRLIK